MQRFLLRLLQTILYRKFNCIFNKRCSFLIKGKRYFFLLLMSETYLHTLLLPTYCQVNTHLPKNVFMDHINIFFCGEVFPQTNLLAQFIANYYLSFGLFYCVNFKINNRNAKPSLWKLPFFKLNLIYLTCWVGIPKIHFSKCLD